MHLGQNQLGAGDGGRVVFGVFGVGAEGPVSIRQLIRVGMVDRDVQPYSSQSMGDLVVEVGR